MNAPHHLITNNFIDHQSGILQLKKAFSIRSFLFQLNKNLQLPLKLETAFSYIFEFVLEASHNTCYGSIVSKR